MYHPSLQSKAAKSFLKNGLRKYMPKLFFMLAMLCITYTCLATITITSSPTLPSGSAGQSYSYNAFTVTSSAPGAITWTVSTNINPASNLEVKIVGGLPVVDNMNPALPVAGTYFFSLTAENTANEFASQDFTVVISQPTDIIFVLDVSGSMAANANPTCTMGCQTKIDALKQAVSLFFDQGVAMGSFGTNDNVSVVYFETSVDNTDANLVAWNPASNITTLKGKVNAKALGNTTNMNAGLASAISKLTTPSRKEIVILFTDGIQNVSPLVTSTGGANPTVHIGANDFSSATPGTKIYAIGLNAPSGAVYSMLGDIAHATNGTAYYNTDPGFTLDESFINSFIAILKGSSPQLIDYRSDSSSNMNERVSVQNFTVNKSAAKILLEYKSVNSNNYYASIRVLKDSVDVTQYGTITSGNGYRLFSMDLPKRNPSGDTTVIRAEGKWSLIIGSNAGAYKASALVDDHLLKYTCSVGDSVYTVGDPLQLKINLAYKGQPLKDAAQVTALVLKPGDDWGDLLAKASVQSKDTTTSGDITSPGEKKGLALLSDSALFSKLLPSKQVVTLTNNNNGTYTGSFAGTELSGPYRVVFLIKGSRADIGTYQRMETLSVMFNFGKIDEANSELSKTWTGDTLSLMFKPIDKYGKLLGPAYDSRIKVTPEPGRVIDNLDGSYTYIFYNTPQASDPTISISINGEPLYNGKASNFGSSATGTTGKLYTHWWFWILLLILLFIIFLLTRKKKTP